MKEEKIPMGQSGVHRWHLMKPVDVGKITLKEASEKIDVSYRKEKRIRSVIRNSGMKGLVHGDYCFQWVIFRMRSRSNFPEAPPPLPEGFSGRNFSHCASLLSKLA
jgi:hypothetical protein